MTIIKKLSNSEISRMIDIVSKAYPTMKVDTKEKRDEAIKRYTKFQNEIPHASIYGVFRENQMVGSMFFYDFKMNMLSKQVPVGGIGTVAVDLLYKKQKIAKEILTFFLKYYRNNKTNMAALYPFRPDFYKKMGFGYGTKMNQYRIKTNQLPKNDSRLNIRYLTTNDIDSIMTCYNEFQSKRHGMITKFEYEIEKLLDNKTVIGYYEKNELKGYMSFSFKRADDEHMLRNDIVVNELVYQDHVSLQALLGFLHVQSDQIEYTTINTQEDNFHFLLNDPRNDHASLIPPVYHESNLQGVGIMYRVLNVQGLFEELQTHNFNNQSCTLKLTISDPFLDENTGSVVIHFNNGFATVITSDHPFDVELSLCISDFSSLIMGVIDLNTLCRYGLAKLSNDEYKSVVNAIFKTNEKPICMTGF